MTVSNTTVKLTYAGNGSNRVFGITFPLLSASHLRVVVTDPDGVETNVTSNFAINTALNALTYPTVASGLEPLATGYTITLVRQTPLTQEIDLHVGHALDAAELESGYDKLTYAVQEIKEEVGRAVKTGVSESAPETAEAYMDAITAAKEAAETAATSAAGSASEAVVASATAAAASTEATTQAQAAAQSADTATSASVTAQSAMEGAQVAQAAAETAAASIATAISEHNQSTDAHADIRTAISGKQDALPSGATGLFLKKTADGVAWAKPSGGGGGGSAEWGNIGGTLADQTDLKNALDAKQDTISDLSTIRTNATAGAGAAATIAGYGNVVTHDASEFQAAGNYAPAAHTHASSEISGLPTVPTKTSQLQNDSGFITDVPVATASVAGKVKPDGITITAAPDGTISAMGGGSSSSLTATYDSTNKVLTLR